MPGSRRWGVESYFAVDWGQVFKFDTSPLEIFIRGTLVYLALFTMLRLVLRRESGSVGMSDILVIVLIADAAQNAMAGNYNSLPDGVLLVATILFWSFALNWLGYHVPFISKFVNPPPLVLVSDGQINRRNMRKELITEDELLSQLRQQGIEDLRNVKRAFMEGDGQISILKKDQDTDAQKKRARRTV
jgi:uncharacterized membrane protein YcaP (DUF421 family)